MHRRLILTVLALAVAAPLAVRAEGKDKKAKQSFLPLESLAVSVVRYGGRRGVLTVEIGIDEPNPVLRDKLDLYIPPLRSAYIAALQPYALGLGPGSLPNADYISMALQRETDRVLGRRGAKLLIGSVLVN